MTSIKHISTETLSRPERQLLVRKYVGEGYDFETAYQKVKNFNDYLKDFVSRLRRQKKPKKEINEKFQREFEKICRSLN